MIFPVAIGMFKEAEVDFTTEYQDVLNFATAQSRTLPSAAQQIVGNQLVVDKLADGTWANDDAFYASATDGDSDFACIDYKSPGLSTDLIKVNTPLFTTNSGFTGDGVSADVKSPFIPNGTTSNYKLDDACIYYKRIGDRSGSNRGDFSDGSNVVINGNGDTKKFNSAAANTPNLNIGTADILFALDRSSSANYQLYVDGVGGFVNTATSTAIPTTQITFLSTSLFLDSTHGFKIIGIGGSLGGLHAANNTNINTYLSNL